MKKTLVAVAVAASLFFAGCTTVQKDGLSVVAIYALQTAYDMGGEEMFNKSIDSLVEDGKVSQEVGENMKAAAKEGCASLLQELEKTGEGGDADSVLSVVASAVEAAYSAGGREALDAALAEKGLSEPARQAILRGVELGYAELKKTLEKQTAQ